MYHTPQIAAYSRCPADRCLLFLSSGSLLTLAVLWIAVYSRELSCRSHEDTLRSAPNVGAVGRLFLIPPRLIFSKRPCYLFIRQAKPLNLKREARPCRNPRHAKDSQGVYWCLKQIALGARILPIDSCSALEDIPFKKQCHEVGSIPCWFLILRVCILKLPKELC